MGWVRTGLRLILGRAGEKNMQAAKCVISLIVKFLYNVACEERVGNRASAVLLIKVLE